MADLGDDRLERELGRLVSERPELGEQLRSTEAMLIALQAERRTLAERLHVQGATLAAVRSTVEGRHERVRSLEAERDRLESERRRLAEQTRAQGARLAALTSRLDAGQPGAGSADTLGLCAPSAHVRLEVATHVAPPMLDRARNGLRDNPLTLSVVIPTYNRAGELRQALSSVLRQSHPPLEIIVSDDGSTDGTQQMLRSEYAQLLESGFVRCLRREERRGVSAARNLALREARGDLVAYLDSDNVWHEHFILIMSAALAEHHDACTAYCALRYRRDGGSVEDQFERRDRGQLLVRNYIDLNVFVHRRRLYSQLGGFDERMTRLVDWDLILRYTRSYPAVPVPVCLVDYYGGSAGERITQTEDLDANSEVVRRHFAHELTYSGVTPLRIGYVLWDFPALSQTFVLAEIRYLLEHRYDVHVYFHAEPDRIAQLDFDVPTFQVASPDELATLLVAHRRTMLHSHFVYPAVTCLTFPAARAAGLPFTFMVHAVDIFHRKNSERNSIAEITRSDLCLRVFGAGEHHRSYLISQGVPIEKTAIARQVGHHVFAPPDVVDRRLRRQARVVACTARFVEKKGIDDLIRAAALVGDEAEIRLYGYGPLEQEYRVLAARLGATNVRFLGDLGDADAVRTALEQADVFALPCVVDENGDMDGLPTVLAEAMAAGVPVVTTPISSIPEIVRDGITGFVVPPRNPDALARKIVEVCHLDCASRRRVIFEAKRTVSDTWTVETIMDSLLDAWARPPLDIALVTYGDATDDPAPTVEIIRRIYEFTTTHFHLTIVDNGSKSGFREALVESVQGRPNASLILLERNLQWGPALNLAIDSARSEFVVYVCSREGFVLRPAWEREYLNYMRRHSDVALAGHVVSSPAFPNGRSYRRQSWFRGFRNKRFAELNPDREFVHVQGGLFALRRAAFMRCGGYSEVVTQAAADIEYSYFLESLGWSLGSVSSLPSVTKKTRPKVFAHLDENTRAAHPLSLESVGLADDVANGRLLYCNMCTWTGSAFHVVDDEARCPKCRSTPLGRLLFRFLGSSGLAFRRLSCTAMVDDETLRAELGRMFDLAPAPATASVEDVGRHDVVIADLAKFAPSQILQALESLATAVRRGGIAIFGWPRAIEGSASTHLLEDALRRGGLTTTRVSVNSAAVRFAPDGILVARREARQDGLSAPTAAT